MLLERAELRQETGADPSLKYRRCREAGRIPGSEPALRPLRRHREEGGLGRWPGTLQPQPRTQADPPDPDRLPMTEGRESFLVLVEVTSSTGPPGRRIKPGPGPPEVFHQEARVLSLTSVLLWLCANC